VIESEWLLGVCVLAGMAAAACIDGFIDRWRDRWTVPEWRVFTGPSAVPAVRPCRRPYDWQEGGE
jgi:hypothetical protein